MSNLTKEAAEERVHFYTQSIRDMYADGLSCSEISEKTGFSESAVRAFLQKSALESLVKERRKKDE